MPWTPRNRVTIRTSFLQDWQSRYQALPIPQTLSILTGSDAFLLGDAIALQIENTENQNATNAKNIFPDTADAASVAHHGLTDGVTQEPAVAWSGKIQISGTPSSTVTFGSSVLIFNGANYGAFEDATAGTPITFIVLGGGGTANVRATCATIGASTTLADLTVLTWSSQPANAAATAQVISGGTVIEGADAESPSAWGARILARRRERPGSGNRADWQAWVLAVDGIRSAYVYPRLGQGLVYPVLGAVTVVPFNPPPGDSIASTLPISPAQATGIVNYIEGTWDQHGNAVANGRQLRPATIDPGDYVIVEGSEQIQDVILQIVEDAAHSYPWTYNAAYTVVASPAPTTTTFSIAGDVSNVIALAGGAPFQPLALKCLNSGNSVIRGNTVMIPAANIVSATFGGTNTAIVVTAGSIPGSGVPVVGAIMYPPPPNWSAIRLAVFLYFDGLGPGDALGIRWPAVGTQGNAVLYKQALAGSVEPETVIVNGGPVQFGVIGVLSATTLTPSSDVTPPTTTVVLLGTLSVHG